MVFTEEILGYFKLCSFWKGSMCIISFQGAGRGGWGGNIVLFLKVGISKHHILLFFSIKLVCQFSEEL